MPYNGSTFKIPCTQGVNYNPNYDAIPPEFMVAANNVNIDSGGRRPRGGSVRQNGTAITDEPVLTGITQFILEGGINYYTDESGNYYTDENGYYYTSGSADLIMGTNDGKIYKNYTTLLKDGLVINKRYNFTQFYNKLYICNGADWPQVWDGVEDYTWDMGTPKKCTAALAGDGAGNVNAGVHSYKVTFVSASGESSGSPASNSVTTTAGDGQVDLTNIQIGIFGTTARKIYRTEAGGSDYKLLATLSDNTTTTYADNIADGSLTTAIPTTNLAFMPSDWTNSKPKYMFEHGRGINKRICAIGVSGYPNALYMSAPGTDDMSDANVTKINFTGSGNGLTAFNESAGNLLPFSADYSFILNDVDANVAYWTYSRAIWTGGAAHQELVVKTPSDMMAVDENIEVYSISAAETYGDYKVASIARPAYIHKWIEENVDKTKINNFFAIYDPVKRCIKIFVVLNGYTYPTAALVYFIDYGWTLHTFASPHTCACLVRFSDGDWGVLTGSDDGFVRRLESETLLDDGAIYETGFTIAPLTFENPRSYKRYDRVWLCMKPRGTETMAVDVTIDNDALAQQTYTMEGLEDWIQEYPLDVGQVGQRIKIEISNTLGEDWYIPSMMVDVEELGSHGK